MDQEILVAEERFLYSYFRAPRIVRTAAIIDRPVADAEPERILQVDKSVVMRRTCFGLVAIFIRNDNAKCPRRPKGLVPPVSGGNGAQATRPPRLSPVAVVDTMGGCQHRPGSDQRARSHRPAAEPGKVVHQIADVPERHNSRAFHPDARVMAENLVFRFSDTRRSCQCLVDRAPGVRITSHCLFPLLCCMKRVVGNGPRPEPPA